MCLFLLCSRIVQCFEVSRATGAAYRFYLFICSVSESSVCPDKGWQRQKHVGILLFHHLQSHTLLMRQYLHIQ